MAAEVDLRSHSLAEISRISHVNQDQLIQLGRLLDRRPSSLAGRSVLGELAEGLLRIRTREGPIEPLRANAAQAAFELQKGKRNIVLKARQLGLTTWIAARFFLKTITHPGTLTLEVAHTQRAAEQIFRIVRRFLDELPAELQTGLLRTSRSSVSRLSFPALDSEYLVISAGDRNGGRGLTIQNLHCSELAHWPGDAAETLAGLRAALTPDAEQILESTPNGVGDCFHGEWQHAQESGVVRHFFPWWMESSYRAAAIDAATETAEERALMAYIGLDPEQIGFRRQIRTSFQGLAAQEFAEDSETCFLSSGDAIFELSVIEERLKSVPDPLERRYNGEMEIWLPPIPGKRYLVSVDPAGGGSEGDYSAVEVLEMETGLQCAEFASHVGGLTLARIVTEIAAEYNQAWLVIERNNHGTGILALAESIYGYTKIYHQGGSAGWLTTSTTRPIALGKLSVALVESPECFASRRLLAECRGFVRLANGKSGARPGMHDDRVLATAIALAAREELSTSITTRYPGPFQGPTCI